MASRVMLIEDQRSVSTLYSEVLEDAGFEVDCHSDGAVAIEALLSTPGRYQLIITDYQMPGLDGLSLLKKLKARYAYLPVLFITAHGSVETAIEAMKHGAFDYQEKPIDLDRLAELAREACDRSGGGPALATEKPATPFLVGRSKPMLDVYKQVGRVAATPATVLVRGETGTGKELVAQAVHQFSPRAEKPFVAVNCAAIPESLLESELFGYEKGAFTGAQKTRLGHFERANGGTLFLDEIGDMPWSTQVKLLRVLQERSIQRLGADESRKIDVRIVAATHRDLEAMIEKQEFRQDLYHRLAVMEIHLPPLRERHGDIPALVEHFLARFADEYACAHCGIDDEALDLLEAQSWPGNVRQLQNVLRKALLNARNLTLGVADIRAAMQQGPLEATSTETTTHNGEKAPAEVAASFSLKDWVREEVRKAQEQGSTDLRPRLIDQLDTLLADEALALLKGNRSHAARLLGVTRRTLRGRASDS